VSLQDSLTHHPVARKALLVHQVVPVRLVLVLVAQLIEVLVVNQVQVVVHLVQVAQALNQAVRLVAALVLQAALAVTVLQAAQAVVHPTSIHSNILSVLTFHISMNFVIITHGLT